jgi:hypothetical protein
VNWHALLYVGCRGSWQVSTDGWPSFSAHASHGCITRMSVESKSVSGELHQCRSVLANYCIKYALYPDSQETAAVHQSEITKPHTHVDHHGLWKRTWRCLLWVMGTIYRFHRIKPQPLLLRKIPLFIYLNLRANSGVYFEGELWVSVTISNTDFNWLWNCFMEQFHQPNSRKITQIVSD